MSAGCCWRGSTSSAVETLEGDSSSHADEAAGDVFPVCWDCSSAQSGLIIPDSCGCSKLGDLAIVQEGGDDIW